MFNVYVEISSKARNIVLLALTLTLINLYTLLGMSLEVTTVVMSFSG